MSCRLPQRTLAAVLLIAILSVDCQNQREASETEWAKLGAEETLRIGSVDGASALTRFRDLAVLDDERIYTLHFREKEVRIHAAEGSTLGSFGRAGDGPGEFRFPVALGVRGGRIWVLDPRGPDEVRLTFFDRDGRFLSDSTVRFRRPNTADVRPPRPRVYLPDGSLLGQSPLPTNRVLDAWPIVRVVGGGEKHDTVFVRDLTKELVYLDSNGEPLPMSQPFSNASLFASSSYRMDAIVLDRTDGRGFRVTRIALAGDTMWSRQYVPAATPLGGAAVDSAVAELAERIGRSGIMSEAAAAGQLAERMSVPSYHPSVENLVVGTDGSVWVELFDTIPDGRTWLILDLDGAPIGTVALPNTFSVIIANEGAVWGRQLDALEIPYLVRYAIGRSPEGPS